CGHGADRHSELGRPGPNRLGLSSNPQPRLVEGVRDLSSTPLPQKADRSARIADRRTRGEAYRMSDTSGSLTRHAAMVACLTVSIAARAFAQAPAPPAPAPDFLTRYDFQLMGAALAIDDPRFSWDTHFGGDLDLFDYVKGRLSIAADY